HQRESALGGGVAVPSLAGESSQFQEDRRGHRVARGDRVVLEALGSGDELLVVVRGVEEPALRVREMEQDLLGEVAGGREPAWVEGRLVEREEALGDVRVVLEVAIEGGAAV